MYIANKEGFTMKKDKIIREGNQRHLKYFNGTDDMRLAGTILLGASGALFVWTWFIMWSYILFLASIILLPIGGVVFGIGSMGKSTDSDIEDVISRLSSEADIDAEKDAAIIKKQLKRPLPEAVCGYDYSDGLMLRKTKDGVVRSEIFKRATIVPLNDGLCVICATVNIPCESVKKEIFTFSYRDVDELRVASERKTVSYGKKSFSVKDSRLEIISGGNIALSLPVKESASLDLFVKEIKNYNP